MFGPELNGTFCNIILGNVCMHVYLMHRFNVKSYVLIMMEYYYTGYAQGIQVCTGYTGHRVYRVYRPQGIQGIHVCTYLMHRFNVKSNVLIIQGIQGGQ